MSEQQDQHQVEEEVLDVQPGHVMPREHYERMAADAAADTQAEQE